jgi:hypothetical protein
MSRAKGPQAGAPHWRREPEQDAGYGHEHPQRQTRYAQPQQGGHHHADDYDAPTQRHPQTHFPQNAFRQLDERNASGLTQGSLASLLNRTAAAHNQPPHADDRGQQARGGARRADPYVQQHRGYQPQQGHHDPAGYDLAHYTPEQSNRAGGSLDPYASQSGYANEAAEGWTGGGWNGQQGHPQAYDQGHDGHYDGHGEYGHDQHGHPDDQDYGYEAEDGEEQEQRRGPRLTIIIGALVGAIAVGGGLAYGYKAMNGSSDGNTPVVRADKAPAKSRPADPGGKEMAHTDKKFMNRYGDDRTGLGSKLSDATETGSARTTSSDIDSSGAPRKVTTLTVNRDGSMAAPNPIMSPNQGGASSSSGGSGVPGMLIEGFNTAPPARPSLRGTASDAQAQQQQPAQTQQQQAAPVRPQIIAKANPTPEPEEQPAAKKPIPREERAATQPAARTAAAAPAAAASGAGFVPVLSSQKSRMDALKAFADMQQKYSDVLQSRTPDVREVDLGERGVWHRLMLGPPGSRESANAVCTQLKAHGFSGCWITSY